MKSKVIIKDGQNIVCQILLDDIVSMNVSEGDFHPMLLKIITKSEQVVIVPKTNSLSPEGMQTIVDFINKNIAINGYRSLVVADGDIKIVSGDERFVTTTEERMNF